MVIESKRMASLRKEIKEEALIDREIEILKIKYLKYRPIHFHTVAPYVSDHHDKSLSASAIFDCLRKLLKD